MSSIESKEAACNPHGGRPCPTPCGLRLHRKPLTSAEKLRLPISTALPPSCLQEPAVANLAQAPTHKKALHCSEPILHIFLIRKGKIMKNYQYCGSIQMTAAHQLVITFKSSLHVVPPLNVSHLMLRHYGEGNGTPLQYSGLENPMDGGAW